ncbi:MAG: ribonuclease PH [Spirochaetes bacterium]|nr:ribonuclease PH [Spirochaetota bacterium]
MRKGRAWNEIRRPKITSDFCPNANGSLLFEMGKTRVICAATVLDEVPDHAASKGKGWITAEYSLMPYSTVPRAKRPLITRDGRAVEIQRVISRSLRGAVDLTRLQGITVQVDCDVIEADGGTRTASITGGFIAMAMAFRRLMVQGSLREIPIISNVAAVSCGYVEGELLLDLDFAEDSKAQVDLNVIMDGGENLVEVQGTGERNSFSVDQLLEMISLAKKGITELVDIQNSIIHHPRG